MLYRRQFSGKHNRNRLQQYRRFDGLGGYTRKDNRQLCQSKSHRQRNGPYPYRRLAVRSSGTITASYATGAVSGNGKGPAGGLVGLNLFGRDMIASYATGHIYNPSHEAGEFVGQHGHGGATITTSYAIGIIYGNTTTAIAGLTRRDTVSGSYCDIGGTGVSATSSGVGTGKTTPELQSPTSSTGIYTIPIPATTTLGHGGNAHPGTGSCSHGVVAVAANWRESGKGQPLWTAPFSLRQPRIY